MATRQATNAEIRRAKKADTYIIHIRNDEKRRYAYEYWGYRRGIMNDPNPDHFNLSVMARQAVRLRLDAIMKW